MGSEYTFTGCVPCASPRYAIPIRGQKANRFKGIAEVRRVGGPASGMDRASRTVIRHRACARAGTRVGEGEAMKPSKASLNSKSPPVLVVDDNEDVREALSEVLRTEGFGV